MTGLMMIAAAAVLASSPPAPAQPQTPRIQMAQASVTATAPTPNTEVRPRLLRVYATPDGESHVEELTVSDKAGQLPLASLTARSYNPTNVTWHQAPGRQFAINLTGRLQVEVSDGTKREIGPGDLVMLEDTTGKGHITRLISPVTCLFLKVADGFDVVKWAAGEAS